MFSFSSSTRSGGIPWVYLRLQTKWYNDVLNVADQRAIILVMMVGQAKNCLSARPRSNRKMINKPSIWQSSTKQLMVFKPGCKWPFYHSTDWANQELTVGYKLLRLMNWRWQLPTLSMIEWELLCQLGVRTHSIV